MKLISSTGYGGTGSSAVTDLISEYTNVRTGKISNYEISLFRSPRGINNLYFHFTQCQMPEVLNLVLHDFYEQCKIWAMSGTSMNYEMFFNNHFLECVREYIQELGGNDYYNTYYRQKISPIKGIISKGVNKIYHEYNLRKNNHNYSEPFVRYIPLFMKQEKFYMFHIDEDAFINITKDFMRRLFESMGDGAYYNLHHLFPITKIDECARYFDDPYIITTERDPRDIFLTAKYRWRAINYPYEDVYEYCKYHRWLRSYTPKETKSKIFHVRFEDLVFHYDDTVRELENFLGLSPNCHLRMKTAFNPAISIEHCNLKKKFPAEADNIAIIEKELDEWIYDMD